MKKIIQQTTMFRPLARFCGLVLPVLIMANAARALTVSFSTADAGVTKSIPYWGYDTAWDNSDNEQRAILFMGINNVNLVRVSPAMNSPLIGSDLWSASISDSDKAYESNLANKTKSLSPNAMWYFCQGAYDNWYRSSTYNVYPDRYAAGFQANVNYVYSLANKPTIWACDFFNEPDYSANNEGSAADIFNVLYYMTNNATCRNFKMGGLGTLNADVALNWFNPLVPRATLGSTHWLAGSATSFKNLITTVKSRNCVACEPETHNVGECIIGANYGLDAAIWWGPAERARGEFVQASKNGKRLGYAEDLTHAVAAAVYKTSSGKIKAFEGGCERDYVSSDTTITFTCTDRDVYFDGHGPQRSYTVTAGGQNDEMVIDITWGSDPQPALNGRYKIINKNSGKALEVPGSNTANGTQLDQSTYTGALNQQWDVTPLSRRDGDYSYYSITAAHDGKAANLDAYSYANGGAINQWDYVNQAQQHWYLEYVGGGYFKIHTRWDAKVLEVGGNSTADGGLVQQWDDAGTASQQWSFQSPTAGTGGPIANGTYRLQNRADGRMMDNMGSTSDGANVGQWDGSSSNNQKWQVAYSGGYYKLTCVTGGKCLDTGGHTANGSTVQQWSSGGSYNQQWTFTATDSGYYKIISRACNQCVDTGGLTANGSALQLWGSGGSSNQQWKFVQ